MRFPEPLASLEFMLFLLTLVETWANPDLLHRDTSGRHEPEAIARYRLLCAGPRGTEIRNVGFDQRRIMLGAQRGFSTLETLVSRVPCIGRVWKLGLELNS